MNAGTLRYSALVAVVAAASVVQTRALSAQRVMQSSELGTLVAGPPDHKLQYGPGPLQFGNLRLPKGRGPFPVVVFVHGGCWLAEYDIAHVGSLEQAMADSGFAVWSLEYRRVGNEGGGWPGTFTDVANGADYLRKFAKEYSLDLNRVIASGHSAGGSFALWLAARKKIPRGSELYAANPLAVQGVVGLAPAPDFEGLHASGTCDNVIDKLMGGSPEQRPDRYAAASPMKLVPVGVPQVLVVGALDKTWRPIGMAYFARTRAEHDTMVTLVEAPESGHFELVAPKTTTWPIVIGAMKGMLGKISR